MATVLETLPNAMFRVSWRSLSIRCWRTFREKCASTLFGFFQVIECWWSCLLLYDLNRGRITYRYK
jgi:hypothetical protein